jgi:spore maturation protein CgeB
VSGCRIAASYPGEYVTDRSKFLAFTCARIVLNTLHYAEVLSANARLFEATAFGGFVVTHGSLGIRDLFESGKEVIAVDTADELREAVDYYLAASGEREVIAAAGQRRAHSEHTYQRRIHTMAGICGF